MISPQDRKLGARELFALITITLGIKFTDMTATLLYKQTAQAAWMIPLVSGLIMLIPLSCILILLKHYGDRNIIDITYKVTGKYFGFLIGMILFLIAYSATIVDSRSYVDIINTMYFPSTSSTQLFLVLVGSSYFLANRGLLAIGRTAWITFPYIKVSLFFIVVLLWSELYFGYLFPLTGYGLKEVAIQGTSYASITSDLLFFSILFPFFKDYKSFKKATLLGLGVSIFELMFFLVIFIMYFDYPSIEFIAYPFHEISRMVTFGRYVSHIEALFFAFWSVASLIRFAVYLYISTAFFAYTAKIKEFEPLILPFAGLTIMLGLLPENVVQNVLLLRSNIILLTTSVLLFIIPITLLLVAKLRGELKK
ncbi:GerAB/ArcD/ProY family transporter [Bacillus sp. SCS-153A]|uniref:GerAB/ArcD/ProY family transporter n=1 Tax=Rossellomorea sedimentorum TaxID=3115294 RepID=UPI003905BB34